MPKNFFVPKVLLSARMRRKIFSDDRSREDTDHDTDHEGQRKTSDIAGTEFNTRHAGDQRRDLSVP